ncbi:MAG: NrfD/PsrC family molybdoenzyme membrane anchor subunit [Thermoleophilia bacterium]
MIPGELWTLKDLFVLPNEYIYWSIQIVMYPFMTGLVAGSFVLSSLYHVFGIKQLKGIASFALVLCFALLPAAMLPLLMHLQNPLRGINVMMTPHFTSAIAAFGVVFSTYFAIVASELWFLYRGHFVEQSVSLKKRPHKTLIEWLFYLIFTALTLGSFDITEPARHKDEKAIRVLATAGIPVALFLHGYAGFIFGSVKANALWMTPLMPVIFIMSAVVSGIALCMLAYIVTMEIRKLLVFLARREQPQTHVVERREEIKSVEISVIKMTSRYLLFFLVFAISLELLDLIFRGYTGIASWDVLSTVLFGKDFVKVFVLQYGLGMFVPLILLLIPGLTIRRTIVGVTLVLFGVFMMRWNVVIGGQAFSLTLAGYMEYVLPVIPHSVETFREGVAGALTVLAFPFVLFYFYAKIFPVFGSSESR